MPVTFYTLMYDFYCWTSLTMLRPNRLKTDAVDFLSNQKKSSHLRVINLEIRRSFEFFRRRNKHQQISIDAFSNTQLPQSNYTDSQEKFSKSEQQIPLWQQESTEIDLRSKSVRLLTTDGVLTRVGFVLNSLKFVSLKKKQARKLQVRASPRLSGPVAVPCILISKCRNFVHFRLISIVLRVTVNVGYFLI